MSEPSLSERAGRRALASNLVVETATVVPYMNESRLRLDSAIPFFVRRDVESLWNKLDAGSCFVRGPPGSGISTAVWFWLLRRVVQTGRSAMWCHFPKFGLPVYLGIVRATQHTVNIERINDEHPISAVFCGGGVDFCIVDGVRTENYGEANKSWGVFGVDPEEQSRSHMIWVSSEQVLIPMQELQLLNVGTYDYYSWSEEEVSTFASTFSAEAREKFTADVVNAAELRTLPMIDHTFEEALRIKMWHFGGSARWIFGMAMTFALEDLEQYVAKVTDAKQLHSGLQGIRAETAVNHVISHYASDSQPGGLFKLISSYVMELLSRQVGLEAILTMYRSPWVRNNPSVHGFVFEWDILTQVEKDGKLQLKDSTGDPTTWFVDENVPLAAFLQKGVTSSRMLVRPEKWNHPEYDGLYIYHDQHGQCHLVAWNASEAATHNGTVSKLVTLMESLAQRRENAIVFQGVRFIFIVPNQHLNAFSFPSGSEALLARQQLSGWDFSGFEVYGATCSYGG